METLYDLMDIPYNALFCSYLRDDCAITKKLWLSVA